MVTCKKGEDDPAVSLLSRKSRLTGEWHLEKGSVTIGIKDSTGAYGGYIFNFDGTSYTQVYTGNSSRVDGKAELSISFTKKGDFTLTQKLDNLKLESSGTWDFQGRVGKNKNKENITLHLSTISGTSDDFSFFNKGNFDFMYSLKELRNKKMVVFCNEEMVMLDSGAGIYVTAEYTFVQ